MRVWGVAALLALSTSARADPPTEISVEGERPLLRHVASDPTAATTVIGEERLERAGQTAADVLQSVPGLTVQRSGSPADLATASIRGSDSAQVPVYIAGIRINDDVTGTADLSTVPLWMMKRVEVFRGNAPDNSDQLGLAGAIFFWPKLPHQNRVGAGVELGSFGERGARAAAEGGDERVGALVAVRHDRATNDYHFPNDQGKRFDLDEHDDVRVNADAHTVDAWAIGRYRLSERAQLTTVVNAFDREQGSVGLLPTPTIGARSHARRLLAGASGYLPCTRESERCRLEADSSVLIAHRTIIDPYSKLVLRTPLQYAEGERANERLALTTDVTRDLRFSLNTTASFEGTRTVREGNLPRRGQRSTLRAASALEWRPLAALSLFGLGALECDSTRGVDERSNQRVDHDSGTCGLLQPAARLGAKLRVVRGFAVLANVGRYFRVPTLSELYGSSPLTDGNSALRPETGVSADLGVRVAMAGSLGRYSADVFGFARDVRDMIGYHRTGLNIVAPYNVQRARALGLEGVMAGEWAGWVRAEVSATLLHATDATPNSERPIHNDVLPLIPLMVATMRLEGFHARGLSCIAQDRVSLGVSYSHRATSYPDPAGAALQNVQNWVDLEAASSQFNGTIKLQLAVRNLLDAPQFDQLYLPLPGRSFHAELEAWW